MSVFNKIALSFLVVVSVFANTKQFFAFVNATSAPVQSPKDGGTGQ